MKTTAIGRAVLLAALLAASGGWASAEGRVAKPAIDIESGRGNCIAAPDEMRRNHMEMLKHQRDKTLRQGERGARVSLNACIDCHASRATGSVNGNKRDFCASCHAYAAVKLDCFECHQPTRTASGALK